MSILLGSLLFVIFIGTYLIQAMRWEYNCPPLREAGWEYEFRHDKGSFFLEITVTWEEKFQWIFVFANYTYKSFFFIPYRYVATPETRKLRHYKEWEKIT